MKYSSVEPKCLYSNYEDNNDFQRVHVVNHLFVKLDSQ